MRIDKATLRGHTAVWHAVRVATGSKGADSWAELSQMLTHAHYVVARYLPAKFKDATFAERLALMRRSPGGATPGGAIARAAWESEFLDLIVSLPADVPGATWDARVAALLGCAATTARLTLALTCPRGTPGATPEARVALIPREATESMRAMHLTLERAVASMMYRFPETRPVLLAHPDFKQAAAQVVKDYAWARDKE